MSIDVLVAGAGPAGLTMAVELARYGVKVRIIERAAGRPGQSQAILLWSRTLELLDRSSCSAALVAAGRKMVATNIVAAGTHIGRVDFAAVDSPHPYALMLPEGTTEQILEAHLNSLGVQVEREVELTAFTDTGTGISASLRRADGSTEECAATWLIGCDGPASIVRQALGLSLTGHARQRDWILAELHITGLTYPPSELVNFWHEDGFLAIYPLSGGLYRIIADAEIGQSGLPSATPSLAQIQLLVDRRGPGGLTVSDPVWLSGFHIKEGNVPRYRSGHVFLAGDAAHLHNPAGAHGMNMGMQDAFNLAWKLALVCRGIGDEALLLESYSAERHTVTEEVLAEVDRMTAVSVLKNPAAQGIRNLLGKFFLNVAPARRALTDAMSEISLGYPSSPLNGPEDHSLPVATPGDRLPPVPGQPLIGAGDTPRFALFAEPDAAKGLLEAYPELLEPQLRPPLSPRCNWLVRPDGYVAAACLTPDIGMFAEYMSRVSAKKTSTRPDAGQRVSSGA